MSEADPQNRYAEFRAHKEMRRWKDAWEASKIILHPDLKAAAIREWWMVADMDEVARLIEWSHDGDNFRWQAGWCDTFASYKKWRVHLGKNLIIQRKDLNIQYEQRHFAKKPVEHVRQIWDNWAVYNCRGHESVVDESLKIGSLNCGIDEVRLAIGKAKSAAKIARDSKKEGCLKASHVAEAAASYASGFVGKGYLRKHSFSESSRHAIRSLRIDIKQEDIKSSDIPNFKHMFNVHLLNIVKNKALTA